MFSWFYSSSNKTNNSGILDNDLSHYVIIHQLKKLEEKQVQLEDKIYKLQDQNKNLLNHINRLKKNEQFLYNQIQNLKNKLDTCIVLEPQTPNIIVNR